MTDPNSLAAGAITIEQFREAVRQLANPPPRDFDAERAQEHVIYENAARIAARGLPLDLRDDLIEVAARYGVGREVIDAVPPPPYRIELPPPTVRQGRAAELARKKRADRKKLRQRRKGDRAGRPL